MKRFKTISTNLIFDIDKYWNSLPSNRPDRSDHSDWVDSRSNQNTVQEDQVIFSEIANWKNEIFEFLRFIDMGKVDTLQVLDAGIEEQTENWLKKFQFWSLWQTRKILNRTKRDSVPYR